jgi:hypothetical protein
MEIVLVGRRESLSMWSMRRFCSRACFSIGVQGGAVRRLWTEEQRAAAQSRALATGATKTLVQRVLENSERHPEGCWLWNGRRQKGYGITSVASSLSVTGKARQSFAHRVSYRAFIGEIPEGAVIDHLCANKLCVNPSHLEAVSCRENSRRDDHTYFRLARQLAAALALVKVPIADDADERPWL